MGFPSGYLDLTMNVIQTSFQQGYKVAAAQATGDSDKQRAVFLVSFIFVNGFVSIMMGILFSKVCSELCRKCHRLCHSPQYISSSGFGGQRFCT